MMGPTSLPSGIKLAQSKPAAGPVKSMTTKTPAPVAAGLKAMSSVSVAGTKPVTLMAPPPVKPMAAPGQTAGGLATRDAKPNTFLENTKPVAPPAVVTATIPDEVKLLGYNPATVAKNALEALSSSKNDLGLGSAPAGNPMAIVSNAKLDGLFTNDVFSVPERQNPTPAALQNQNPAQGSERSMAGNVPAIEQAVANQVKSKKMILAAAAVVGVLLLLRS